MDLERFGIFFDNPQATFYAGQNVSGKLVVTNSIPMKVKVLTINGKGEAEVTWTERRRREVSNNDGQNSYQTLYEDITHTNREVYFNNKFVVVTGGGKELIVYPGEHIFPFHYVLPKNLPSSFKSEHGYVRYSIEAVLIRSWKLDQKVKANFTVICPLDLNADPAIARPISKCKSKTFCCLWCASGPVNVELSLPSGGAVPGETIMPTLDIENNSKSSFSNVRLLLTKDITYKAKDGETKYVEIIIANKTFRNIDPGESITFERKALQIPPNLPPSNLKNCSIIGLDYWLQAILTPSGIRPDIYVAIPVVIGTIPLRQNVAESISGQKYSPPPPGWNISPSAPFQDESCLAPQLPPPTYDDSMRGAYANRGYY